MNGLVRFRTRDGRYVSGGPIFDLLKVRPGPPTAAETFAFGAGTSQPPMTDGGILELVVPGSAGPFRWTMVAHSEASPGETNRVCFGGTSVNSEVFVANYGLGSGLFLNEFGARVSGGEVSFLVRGCTNDWFFRVDADNIVRALGTAPFQSDTAFIFELGPFCAAVTGIVRDATSLQPITGARVVTDGGFAGTTAATGRFDLVDAAGATCVPEGAHLLTVTEERHQSETPVIIVPSGGTLATEIVLACREIRGKVVDEAGLGSSPYSVGLIGPTPNDPQASFQPDPITGDFLFRCVRQGTYTLTYPGADDLSVTVKDQSVDGLVLTVKRASVTGYVLNATTRQRLEGASVRVLGTQPLPAPVTTQAAPDLGRYTITGVRPGPQTLRAEMSNFTPNEVSVNVPTNGQVTQDIELTPVSPGSGSSAVFNTGVDNNRMTLPGGTPDPHWQVFDAAGVLLGPAVVVTEQHPFGLYFTTNDSMWIWLNADGSGPVDQGFRFHLEFALASVEPTTRITGDWGCDNLGVISLNNRPPAGTGITNLPVFTEGNFTSSKHFMIVAPFQVGLNTLDVTVTDRGNPGGLNVSKLLLTL
jgi:Carboxypeptidase regulatory-like domain